MAIAIKTINLKQYYVLGKVVVPALRGVDIEIREGEFVSVVGTSGSGKSTLLNLVGGLARPTDGKVFVKNKDLSLMDENELAIFRRKYVGFIFQSFNLIPTLTAIENVELPLIFSNIPQKERNKRVKKLLKDFGLEDRILHKPTELSGGQQQRVSIARAIVNNPEIILADEPTGNLDTKTSREIMEILYQLNKKGQTFLVVTHDIDVSQYGTRIVHLQDGKIVKIEEV